MLQHVNTVLIGNKLFNGTGTIAAGDIVVTDENKKVLADAAAAADANELYVGVYDKEITVTKEDGSTVAQKVFTYSMPIKKGSKFHVVASPYAAKVEDKWSIDFTGVTPVIGYMYTIRLVYSDIYEAPGQFTHSYNVIATSTTAADLASAFAKKINKHKNRRVKVTLEGSKITLEAMEKDDNEGKNSINYYSQVVFRPFIYSQNPESIVEKKDEIAGIVVTHDATSNPGKGNAKIVRDRESAALGYRGIMNRTQFPVLMPELKVNLNAEYDTVTVEFDNLYLSNDNQYIKTTPLATEIYATTAGEGAKIAAIIEGFAA